MVKIRYEVFETNSSSMHTLVIQPDNIIIPATETSDSIRDELAWYIEDDALVFDQDLYFGRHPFKILTGFGEKFKYALACHITEEEYAELEEILKRYLPEIHRIVLPDIIGTDESYVQRWLSEQGISMEEFLTNNKYIVICDGDEYCIWEQMKDAGIISKDITEV